MTLPVVSVTDINFRKTECVIDGKTGLPTLTESIVNEVGKISLKPVVLERADVGRTKELYLVSGPSAP